MSFSAAALALFASADAAASATALAGGTVDFLSSGGTVLASASLGTPTAAGAVTTGSGFPRSVPAVATGTVASARLRTSGGDGHAAGITVGLPGSGAQAILSALSVTAGQTVTVDSVALTHAASNPV